MPQPYLSDYTAQPYLATLGSTQCIQVARVENPEDYDMPQLSTEGTITLRVSE